MCRSPGWLRGRSDVAAPASRLAERCGPLLQPGTHTIALDPGQFFRTLADADLRVVHGGVTTDVAGDDPDGEVPTLTVE